MVNGWHGVISFGVLALVALTVGVIFLVSPHRVAQFYERLGLARGRGVAERSHLSSALRFRFSGAIMVALGLTAVGGVIYHATQI